MKQVIMKVTRITIEQMLNSDFRNYNPDLWEKKVNRFCGFGNVQFYHVPKGNGYGYDRHFVSYLSQDGVYRFASFDYESSISNKGFCKIHIDEIGNVERSLFNVIDGRKGYAANTPGNIEYFKRVLAPAGIMVCNEL